MNTTRRIVVGLPPEVITAIAEQAARRTVELLRGEPARASLVDAATVAAALGVSRDYVYAHAHELGGERIGGGPRGRLRFDLDRALLAGTSRSASKESRRPEAPVPSGGSVRRRRRRMGSGSELLPIRDPKRPFDDPEGRS